jgi:hypothetical protein
MTINEKILDLLSRGDLFVYELKDALGVSYGDLWGCLEQLKKENKISQYFRDTFPSPTICFCLSENRKQSLSVRWGKGIKPWTPASKPVK